MRQDITPLSQLSRRPPEAGRIRMGKKSAKNAPMSIDTFRFTSPFEDVVRQLATLYGGRVVPWHDPKASPQHQFELESLSKEIQVYLVPDGLSIWYEEWSGGGCTRRCDGITCQIPQYSNDGMELAEVPCMCVATGRRSCDPHTRLSVILPQLSFRGVWRLETKGWNAAQELPGMFDLIVELGERGQMVQALLATERREQPTKRGKRTFVVPRLSIAQSVLELQAGGAGVQGIGTGVATPQAALGPSSGPATPMDMEQNHWQEDEPIDAEVLDDELLEIEGLLEADAANFGLDPRRFVEAVRLAIGAEQEAMPEQRERMRGASRKMRAGELVPLGINAAGRVQWDQRKGG